MVACSLLAACACTPAAAADGAAAVTGELKKWHKVTLSVAGPPAAESSHPSKNPFLHTRMTVRFHHVATDEDVFVPGYFAADGQAGETGAVSGNVWRAHLCPRKTGLWRYTVSLVAGSNAAIALSGGSPTTGHGLSATFAIAESDKPTDSRDFRGKGMILPVDGYLVHDNGQHFVKVGTDSPETMLGYVGFDGTETNKRKLHDWASHTKDWAPGDPTWKNGNGKGLVGAFNYLASTGMNAVAFLTYNLGGDGDNVWPFISRSNRLVYDCSKLDQWEVLFEHADQLGLFLHFKLQETENDNGKSGLDNGAVGSERTVYYRELVARFGHHLGLGWNLGEENSQTDQQRADMVRAVGELDSYGHHVDIHSYPGQYDRVYIPLLGAGTVFTGVSLQTAWNQVHQRTLTWRERSAAAGKLWIVSNDEQNSPNDGIPPDDGWPGFSPGPNVPKRSELRHKTLWGNLMAGGGGVEAYFGYKHPENDLGCNNWRSRASWWEYCDHARELFENHVPFWQMKPADSLVFTDRKDSYGLADDTKYYLAYIPGGSADDANVAISVKGSSAFTVRWWDPRAGGVLQKGSVNKVAGSGSNTNSVTRSVGFPPSNQKEDWAVFLKSDEIADVAEPTPTQAPTSPPTPKPTDSKTPPPEPTPTASPIPKPTDIKTPPPEPTPTASPTSPTAPTPTTTPSRAPPPTPSPPASPPATLIAPLPTPYPTQMSTTQSPEPAVDFPTGLEFDWVRQTRNDGTSATPNQCCKSDDEGTEDTWTTGRSIYCRPLCGEGCFGFNYNKKSGACRFYHGPLTGLVAGSSAKCRCYTKQFAPTQAQQVHITSAPTPAPRATPTAATTLAPATTPSPQRDSPTSTPTATPAPTPALPALPKSACGVGKHPAKQSNGICPEGTHAVVATLETCAALAVELGERDTKPTARASGKRPKGCFVFKKQLYFNTKGSANKQSKKRRAICCSL